ncbi:uncharacterized protein LOC126082493 [Elephas maximus indicus]|uniref:uncharacterized protein LOC126082493 n=1 Tax=Elephas maximus indicus TaxID=99487 RepID=UPI002116363B|nr:uncharacterized protein LOC126082493 [Elephas maximus indicus]
MVRATAAQAARPNFAVAAEVRLALPSPRTTSAARRGGQGGGGAGRFRLAGAPSIHGPRLCRAAGSRCRPCPAPGAIPPTGAPAPLSQLPWKDATRGGRKFIRLKTPPRRWKRKLQEGHTPSAVSPSSQSPTPAPAGPHRSGILLLSNNFAESHHVTIQPPSNWPAGRVIQLCLLSPPCQSERPFGGEVRLELKRAANPTVPFRCLVLPLQPRTPTFKRVIAGRLEGRSRASSRVHLSPGARPGLLAHISVCGALGRTSPRCALVSMTKENFSFDFPARKQLSDFLQTLQSQQPTLQSKMWRLKHTEVTCPPYQQEQHDPQVRCRSGRKQVRLDTMLWYSSSKSSLQKSCSWVQNEATNKYTCIYHSGEQEQL